MAFDDKRSVIVKVNNMGEYCYFFVRTIWCFYGFILLSLIGSLFVMCLFVASSFAGFTNI